MALTFPRQSIVPFRELSKAFTLLELLVSIAVLILLTVLVSQMTNSTANTTNASQKYLDADIQARLAFSRMDLDFQGMINRKDVDCFFCKNANGSDAMYFYSEAPGCSSISTAQTSTASFVGYRIANHRFSNTVEAALYPDNVLERVGAALYYQGTDGTPQSHCVAYLVYSGSLPLKNTTLGDVQQVSMGNDTGMGVTWDGNLSTSANLPNSSSIIADAIFRMEFCFQVKDPSKYGGRTFVVPVAPGAQPWANASFSGTGASTNATNPTMRQVNTDVAAVIVTIAVLDPKSRAMLTAANIADAARALPDGDDPSVASAWITAINNGKFKSDSKLTQVAASQVRVYQRSFPIATK
jgi:type II secretory pathway component PulJ